MGAVIPEITATSQRLDANTARILGQINFSNTPLPGAEIIVELDGLVIVPNITSDAYGKFEYFLYALHPGRNTIYLVYKNMLLKTLYI